MSVSEDQVARIDQEVAKMEQWIAAHSETCPVRWQGQGDTNERFERWLHQLDKRIASSEYRIAWLVGGGVVTGGIFGAVFMPLILWAFGVFAR